MVLKTVEEEVEDEMVDSKLARKEERVPSSKRLERDDLRPTEVVSSDSLV